MLKHLELHPLQTTAFVDPPSRFEYPTSIFFRLSPLTSDEKRCRASLLGQYVEVARGAPALQTTLARAAAFDHLAGEKHLAIDGCRHSEAATAAKAFMNNVG